MFVYDIYSGIVLDQFIHLLFFHFYHVIKFIFIWATDSLKVFEIFIRTQINISGKDSHGEGVQA